MFRSSRLGLFGLFLAGAVALSGCVQKVNTSGGQRPAGPAAPANAVDLSQPVKIALLTPASASNPGAAELGKALANAARLSATESGERLLRLEVYDTGGDANRARAMAERAIQDGAKLIIGPLFWNNATAVARPASRAGIKIISFSTNADVAGDPVYLSGFMPEVEGRRIAAYARSRGLGSIGIFYPDDPTGNAAFKGAREAIGNFAAAAKYERTVEGISAAARTFGPQARAAGVQAVLIPEAGQALGVVAEQLSRNGLDAEQVRFLGVGGWNSRATLQTPTVRGGWFPAPDPTAMAGFVNKYKASYGAAPPILAMLGYDAVQIAAQMMAAGRRAGSSDPFSTAALTRPQGFRGIVGPIRFQPNGIGVRGMAVLQVDRSVFRTVDRAPAVFGAGS